MQLIQEQRVQFMGKMRVDSFRDKRESWVAREIVDLISLLIEVRLRGNAGREVEAVSIEGTRWRKQHLETRRSHGIHTEVEYWKLESWSRPSRASLTLGLITLPLASGYCISASSRSDNYNLVL